MSLLTRYEPRSLSTWLDDVLTGGECAPRSISGLYPVVEVHEEKDHFVMTAEIPGLTKEDITIEVKNGVLTLSGEKKHEKQEVVWKSVIEQRVAGNMDLLGMMLESNLNEGNQKIPADLSQLKYGVSVTDACVNWETTERLLQFAYDQLK